MSFPCPGTQLQAVFDVLQVIRYAQAGSRGNLFLEICDVSTLAGINGVQHYHAHHQRPQRQKQEWRPESHPQAA